MEPQNIYWLFSSSAQAIATFIAFLLTGYALVLQMMDSVREQDETLQPIHNALKQSYYNQIVTLAILTGVSILFSLGMTYLNGLGISWIGWLVLTGFLLNAVVIAGAIWFVTRIIDPNRYGKKATSLLQAEEEKLPQRGEATTRPEFIDTFIELEKMIRDFLKKRKMYEPSVGKPRMSFSFRQMVDALWRAEVIKFTLRSELLEINDVRNLVFHGHREEVDSNFTQRVRKVHEELREVFKKYKRPAA